MLAFKGDLHEVVVLCLGIKSHMQLNMVGEITRWLPERSLVIRSGSDATYFVLKTRHQIVCIAFAFALCLWMLVASIGFGVSHQNLASVQAALDETIAKHDAFLEQLEFDQRNAHELRADFQAEVSKNQNLIQKMEMLRGMAEAAVGDTAPIDDAEFVAWFELALSERIDAVDSDNQALSELIMKLSRSVAKIAGHQPPEQLVEVRPWFAEVADELATAYQKQSESMQTLYDVMTEMLARNYATVERTPLATPEIAGFSPIFGMGGPMRIDDSPNHSFQSFDDRATQLLRLSQDWQQVQQLLDCAPLVAPVDYYNLTSRFGQRKDPFTKRPSWHDGVDLGAWPGTKVRATAPGVVRHAGLKGGYGRLVVVDHGCGIQTLYGHLKSVSVKKGQQVSYRDVVGSVGSTGRSTGPHVHYEIRIRDKAVNPYEFIEAGRYVFKEQDVTIADAQ